MNKLSALRIILAIICVAHLVLGMCALVAPADALAKVAAASYGASLDITPQMHHVIRILGAFMVAVGVMAGMAAYQPGKHRGIIVGIVLLLVIRVAQRLIFHDEIQTHFGLSNARIWSQAIFFLATAAALLLLRPKADAGAATTSAV